MGGGGALRWRWRRHCAAASPTAASHAMLHHISESSQGMSLEGAGLLGGNRNNNLTEAQLRARGQTASQAARNLVTQQTEEIAMQQLTARIRAAWMVLLCLFCCTIFPLCFAVFGVTIWAAISVDQDSDKTCDKPIRVYVWGFIALVCWVSWCQNLFIKCVLKYDPNQDGAQRPRRVQFYHTLCLLVNIGWNVTGLVWVCTSVTCHKTAPHMFESAKVLVFLQLTVYVLFGCMMSILLWLYWAVRNGQIRTNGAPDGFVDSLEVVAFDPTKFDDEFFPKECSICYDNFSAEDSGTRAIVQTSCSHIFHKECVGKWLQGNQTCPICRTNLVQSTQVDAASAV